jgi:WD40 repeat protein
MWRTCPILSSLDFVMAHWKQKWITLLSWALLLLVSLACGPMVTQRGPVLVPPIGDDNVSPLSHPDREFPKEAARVRALAFDPTGRWLATGGDDGKIRVCDFRYFAGAASVAARGPITSLAYSPDGRLVASGSEDGTVQLWDALRWKEERALIGHKGAVNCVAFNPDGDFVVSGGADRTVKVWEIATGRNVKTLSGHTGAVNAMAFSPDGEILATASSDGTVRVWDWRREQALRVISGHGEPVHTVDFRPDGRILASGSGSLSSLGSHGGYALWDTKSWSEVPGMSPRSPVVEVAFRPDGEVLAVAYKQGWELWGADLYDFREARVVRHFVAHRGGITALAWSPDGTWLVSAGADRRIAGWRFAR